MRVTSLLLRQKKVTKEKATPSLRPLRVAKGRPASGRLRGAPQNSLRAGALRSNNCGELDNDAGALRRACSPRNRPAAGAASRGGEPNSQTATRAIAALGLAVAARSACAFWAERSAAKQWPVWLLAPQAPLYAPRSAAGGVACGPQDTHASWSDSSQLFERSASARSEFCDAPRPRAPQVAPARSAGDADSGVAFSLVTFFLATQKKVTRMPGDSRPPPSTPACLSNQQAKASTGSARTDRRGNPETTKTIATSA